MKRGGNYEKLGGTKDRDSSESLSKTSHPEGLTVLGGNGGKGGPVS